MISVDMCINNVLPVQNTKLIKAYCNCSPMTRPLVMFVKHWATKRELNQKCDSQNLNSYAFILLVIFYLQ